MAGQDETLRMVAELVDRVSAPLRKIGAGLAAIGSSPYVTRLRTQFGQLGGALAPIGGLLSGAIAGGLAAVGVAGLSAGAALTGLLAALNSAKDRLDDFDEQAQLTGMSLQQLRELQYAMKFSGVDWGTASAALIRMQRNLGELRSGTGAYGKQVAKTDKTLYNQLKRTKTSTEAFTVLHKRMSAIKDPAQRVAFAMKHFGKSGADLAKSASSAEEFVEKLEAARKFRGILPNDAGEKAGALNDRIDELKFAFEGLADAIGYQVFDAYGTAVGGLAEWIAANREWIATGIADALKDLGEWVRSVDWMGFARDMRDAGVWVKDLVEKLGGLKNVFIGIGAVLAAGPILALVNLGRTLVGLGAAAAGVSTGALLLIAGAGVAIARDWENVAPRLREAGNALAELGSQSNATSFVEELKSVENATKGIEQSIKGALEKGLLDLAALFGDAGGQSTKAFLDGLDALPGLIGARMVEMYAGVDAQWQTFTAQAREAAAAFGNAIYEGIASGVGRVADYVGGILDSIASKIRSVISMIPGLSSATEQAAGAAERRAVTNPGVGVGRPIPPQPAAPGKQSRAIPSTPLGGQGGGRQVAQAEPVRGEARVTVDFKNMPKGTTATASTDGGLFKSVDVNRGAAMKTA